MDNNNKNNNNKIEKKITTAHTRIQIWKKKSNPK